MDVNAHRFSRTALALASIAALLIVLTPSSASAATGTWDLVVLRPLNAGESASVADINNAGTSVGISGTNAVKWDPAGNPTLLPLPAGCTQAQAARINAQGDIAGTSQCGSSPEVATVWYPNGTITVAPSMYVGAFNNSDTLAGLQLPNPQAFEGHAVLAAPGGTTQGLAEGGASSSEVTDLTNTYLAVGHVQYTSATTGLPQDAAVGWYGPYVFPLINGGANSTDAVAANDAGYSVVTITPAAGGLPYSVIVAPHGRVIPLTSGTADEGTDINSSGVVVGDHQQAVPSDLTITTTPMMYVYGTAVALQDLLSPSAPAVDMQSASAINDNFWVVGSGSVSDTQTSSWLMRPA